MDLLRQFNKYSMDQRSLVQKAMLTAQTNVGEGLIPQHLEKVITNLMVALSPEIAVITPRYDAQKYHEFNRLTALPAPGGAMGEAAVTPTNNSTYQRTGRYMKVVRRKGAVTNFLQDASKNYIDAASIEMENNVQAHVYDLVAYLLYGNDGANPYSFPGLDILTATNRINQVAAGLVPVDLSVLDDLIDRNTTKQGMNHRKCFVMSPQMLSKFSRLLTNVRLNQGVTAGGMSTVEIPGGWRLQAYRDVPIIQSTQCRPGGVSNVGTMGQSITNSGGTIGSGTYYMVMSSVTWRGEQQPSAECSATATGTAVDSVTWTADPAALYYKIYCATSSGAEKLVCILPANVYDSAGTLGAAITQVQFTSNPATANPTIGQINSTTPFITINASVPTAMANDLPLYVSGSNAPGEYLFFWDLDEFQGMGKVAFTNSGGSRFNGLISLEPLAKTDDNLPFLIKSYLSLIDSWEATSAIVRNLKVA